MESMYPDSESSGKVYRLHPDNGLLFITGYANLIISYGNPLVKPKAQPTKCLTLLSTCDIIPSLGKMVCLHVGVG